MSEALRMLNCVASGLVYTNPQPFLRAIHTWHPSIVGLGDGQLICAFDLGQAAESLDYRTYISRSYDNGATWGLPTRLFAEETERPTTHTVRISRLRDGSLVGFGARFYRDDPNQGLTNRATLGFVPMDLILLRSVDGGMTWEGPTTIEPPLVGPAFELCHSVLELADGRWLAPTQTWPDWNGHEPNGMSAIALISTDKGQTWSQYIPVFGRHDKTIHFEQSIIQLTDGRLVAVAWAYDKISHTTGPTPYTVSHDGQTFCEPYLTGMHGQTAKLLALSESRILCVYRRHDQPGLWAQLAYLDGDRWINLEELQLWQGAVGHRTEATNTSDELSELKFGFPSLIRLSADEVLVVFWCEESSVHKIRWFRLLLAPHVGSKAATSSRLAGEGIIDQP